MIKCNESGSIVVEIDDAVYDLSNSEQYADFLLWATSPDEKKAIGGDVFEIAGDVPDEYRAKASRYAEFLSEYARRRQEKLTEMAKSLTTEQREARILAFIENLKGADE